MPRLIIRRDGHAVNPNVKIWELSHIYDINHLYGFFTAFCVYSALSFLFPVPATLIEKMVPGEVEYYEGTEMSSSDIKKTGHFGWMKSEKLELVH